MVVNVSTVAPTAISHLIIWPTGTPMPSISTLNVQPGVMVANNMVIAEVGDDGKIDIYNHAGEIDVILDRLVSETAT